MSRRREIWKKKLLQVTQEKCPGGGACKHTPATSFAHRHQSIPHREVAILALETMFPNNMRKERKALIMKQFVGAR